MKNLHKILFGALIFANGAFFSVSSFAETSTAAQASSADCHTFAWNLEAAQKGNIEAQYDLGMM